MRGYIITMSVAAVFASLLEIFAPKDWEKYVKLATGIIILSIILSPVQALKKERISPDETAYHIREAEFYDQIALGLKENVERDIKERLEKEFGITASCKVDIDVDENHNIRGVNAIRIYSKRNHPDLKERLEEIYGCERIEIVHE